MIFRRRLIATATSVTALTLGVAFATVGYTFVREQLRELDTALVEVARVEASEAPGNDFRFSKRPGPAANDIGPLTKYGVMYDEHGAVLVATEPFDPKPPRLADVLHPLWKCFDFKFESADFRGVLVPIPGYPGRTVLIATSRAELERDRRFLFNAMLLAALASVAWAAALTTWIVRRQTRGQERIAAVARRVAAGDLSARVSDLGSDEQTEQVGRDIDLMITQLSTLVSSQERFVANAAHELQSPITVLYGELQQALRKPRDNEAYRAAIEKATEATRRLKVLAQDLLSLARAKHLAEQPTAFALKPLVVDAVEAQMPIVSAKRINVGVHAEAVDIVGRRREIERMLRNLIENAVRHAPNAGHVQITVLDHARSVEISVEDDGAGIREEDRERIFEPFYRATPSSDGNGGVGLGLAIAREIASAHGGNIVVLTTAADHGARFTVTLPAHRGEAPPADELLA